MSHGPRRLRKPITRRIGKLIVRITDEGIWLRGYRRRSWRKLTWCEVAAIAAEPRPLFDLFYGAAFLADRGAQPNQEPKLSHGGSKREDQRKPGANDVA